MLKPLSQQELMRILKYDPLTGVFTWLEKIADKVIVGSVAGTNKNGYVIIRIYGHQYRAHRLAFLYMTGCIPVQVDHQDHIRSNNRWLNLVAADYQSNGKNHPKTKRNSTGFVGVSKRPDGKFISRIYANKKHKFLGVFSTPEAAYAARQQANVTFGFHTNHGV
jgi:hypothetical protein